MQFACGTGLERRPAVIFPAYNVSVCTSAKRTLAALLGEEDEEYEYEPPAAAEGVARSNPVTQMRPRVATKS